MKDRAVIALGLSISAAALAGAAALPGQDKYSVQVSGGLALAEFRGYERWSVVAVSENLGKLAVLLGNPAMIKALQSGIPENGKPFPERGHDGEGPQESQEGRHQAGWADCPGHAVQR